MKLMVKHFIFIVLAICGLEVSAQEAKALIKEGNKSYSANEFEKAAEQYQKSIEANPERLEGLFNLGDALYRQEKYEEAARYFNMVAQRAEDKEIKAKAYHNLGNAMVKQQKLKEGVEAYKNSLLLNPKDDETRFNLAYSMRDLQKKQEQQKDQQEQQEQEQEQEQQEQNQQEQEQEQQEQEQQEQEQEQQEQEQNQQEQEQQEQEQKNEVSREDATRLLEALENEEKKVQGKLKKKEVKSSEINIEKNW